MNRRRSALAAALLTAVAGLASTHGAQPAAAHRTLAPSPNAPHRGTVASARTPGHDPARDRAVAALKKGRDTAFRAERAEPTHDWWGVFPQPGTHDGITATHTVDPAYRVSDADNFTYAPTTKAQNSCMEVVTAYWNSGNEIWAWDWCGAGGPAKTVTVDADFKAKYAQPAGRELAYSVQLVRDNASRNTWSSYLYNYRSAQWELLYRQSGRDQSGLAHGWDMFEIYASVNPSTGTGYYCSEARDTVFDSSAIQLRHNGAWKPASPSDSPWTDDNPSGRDFLCPALKFVEAGADDHWTVRQ
ncbi:carbohydrate-binding protein [Streptomyces sp. ASQP_92]|uniref:carbohydrate-binding protein n=1 Tax=Streptomyces sp. ASQP_92 TaxID=2979116 RepID=UPI0021BE2FEA|nr:carbohydrate-binding protein [Streptomyces sp. ASQP_92]MCT9092316.1 carbohydrate-binding protein [Streptomyces sp. ASQP_92]